MTEAYESVFNRARRHTDADCGALLGVKASSAQWRQLRGKKQPCPSCGHHDCFSFKRSGWKCHATGATGSAIDLAALIWGVSPFDAACKIVGADAEAERKAYAQAHGQTYEARREHATRGPARNVKTRPAIKPIVRNDPVGDGVAAVIERVLDQMRPGTGSLVEIYFKSRALPARFASRVWFAPDAPYDASAAFGRGRSFPAMVCEITVDGAPTGGWHLTYLRRDGAGKIDTLREHEPTKKMWGPQLDARGRAGGILLIPPRDDGLLVVAEGIENAFALAAVASTGRGDAGAFAAGSLGRLQGGMALNAWGREDWRRPRPDPDKPAATLRHRGPVLIGTDGDMKPLYANRDTPRERVIATPAVRAQVSGLLAAHWWRRAGSCDVRALTTPAGMDANDVLMEKVA